MIAARPSRTIRETSELLDITRFPC
jgi:hypothetical protein